MTSLKMHDLIFSQLDDGTVRLEQCDGIAETVQIDLHVSQLRLIAEYVGLMCAPSPCSEALLRENAKLGRRLGRLRDLIDHTALNDYYRGEVLEHCGCGGEMITELDSLLLIADEFVTDLPAEYPRESCAVNRRGDETALDIPTPQSEQKNAPERVGGQLPLVELG